MGVYEDIDGSKTFDDFINQILDTRFVGYVHPKRSSLGPGFGMNAIRHLLQSFDVPACNDDLCSHLSQFSRTRFAETSGAAYDDCDLAIQIKS